MPFEGTPMAEGGLETAYRLMSWFSPAFPVGSFSYSGGLETLIADGAVDDAESLGEVVSDLLAHGPLRNDAILFAAAHRVAAAGDQKELSVVAELAAAMPLSASRRLETMGQGGAFAAAVAAWADERPMPDPAKGLAYPVAAGRATGAHRLPLAAALTAYLHSAAASLVSVGVRLVPIGQSDGVRILASLQTDIVAAAASAAASSIEDLGGASFLADIAAMRHETLPVRIFRS